MGLLHTYLFSFLQISSVRALAPLAPKSRQLSRPQIGTVRGLSVLHCVLRRGLHAPTQCCNQLRVLLQTASTQACKLAAQESKQGTASNAFQICTPVHNAKFVCASSRFLTLACPWSTLRPYARMRASCLLRSASVLTTENPMPECPVPMIALLMSKRSPHLPDCQRYNFSLSTAVRTVKSEPMKNFRICTVHRA